MKITAESFQPMLSSVIKSPDTVVTLGKQPVLAELAKGVRTMLNAMPPEVTRELLSEYRAPTPQLLSAMESAVMSRELAIENATQESNLDQEWLANGGENRTISEPTLSANDDWNTNSSV